MLLAQRIEVRPDAAQRTYIDRACGSRRHAYNQLLRHFKQPGVKWSKKAAYEYFLREIRPIYPWYSEVSSRVTRNAIDDLDNAFKHFFRRARNRKAGEKIGFPTFKCKDVNDSFAMRERPKFNVDGRMLRIEKMPGRMKMRQKLRFTGETKQVTVSKQAGRYYASILADVTNYDTKETTRELSVGVDLGVKELAVLSNGERKPANAKLKANLRRLKRRQRRLAHKQRGSNQRAKAKLSVARLHQRIANQRRAVLHELSDNLTRRFEIITIEDLNVKGMLKNRSLARSVADAGFGMLRSMLEYKAGLRGNTIILADRFYPSSKTCFECKAVNPSIVLGVQEWACPSCGTIHDRDYNAARNLDEYGLHTFRADLYKRMQERDKTPEQSDALVLTA
jgi:putative transposase